MLALWTILAATNFSVGNTLLGCACVVCQLICVGAQIRELVTGDIDDE